VAKLIPITMPAFVMLLAKAQTVGVIGFPGVGKTTLCTSIMFANKAVIHTDDYLKEHTHDERPAKIVADLKSPYVVEGNEVTRLITRGLKLDLLVCVNSPTEKTSKSMNGLRGRLQKFLAQYPGNVYVINPRAEVT